MIFQSAESIRLHWSERCVLLDGCFDPLHFGHVKYIRDAKLAFPDRSIVVAVAPDSEIRAKGREPLLGQMSRCGIVDGLKEVDVVIAADRPTHEIISLAQPAAYVKGRDWENTLPAEIQTACALHDVQIVYLGERLDSSSDRLRQWALKDAEQSLDRLETFMAAQETPNPETFNKDYFQGSWRSGGNVYDYETRKQIEGDHPDRIVECFPQMSILDVGCGPGYLVRMLRERGVVCSGIDTSREAVSLALDRSCVLLPVDRVPQDFVDVAICREVLEHMAVDEIPAMVCDLFRVARQFVYITTRFHQGSVLDAVTDFETDPTHISLLTQPFLRSLCVLNGGKRRRDLEARLDHMGKGRCLVYATPQ